MHAYKLSDTCSIGANRSNWQNFASFLILYFFPASQCIYLFIYCFARACLCSVYFSLIGMKPLEYGIDLLIVSDVVRVWSSLFASHVISHSISIDFDSFGDSTSHSPTQYSPNYHRFAVCNSLNSFAQNRKLSFFALFRRCALLPSPSSSWSSDVCHFTFHAYVCQLIDGGSIVLVRSPSHIDPFHSQRASHSESEHFSFTDEHRTNKKKIQEKRNK